MKGFYPKFFGRKKSKKSKAPSEIITPIDESQSEKAPTNDNDQVFTTSNYVAKGQGPESSEIYEIISTINEDIEKDRSAGSSQSEISGHHNIDQDERVMVSQENAGAFDPSYLIPQGLINYELYNESLVHDIRDEEGRIEFYHKSCEWMSYSYWNNNICGYERDYK